MRWPLSSQRRLAGLDPQPHTSSFWRCHLFCTRLAFQHEQPRRILQLSLGRRPHECFSWYRFKLLRCQLLSTLCRDNCTRRQCHPRRQIHRLELYPNYSGYIARHCLWNGPCPNMPKARRIVDSNFHATPLNRKEYAPFSAASATWPRAFDLPSVFLQCLRHREAQLHRFRQIKLSDHTKQDLVWLLILHSSILNGVSFEFFHGLPFPDVVVETDVSDYGLYALDTNAVIAIT